MLPLILSEALAAEPGASSRPSRPSSSPFQAPICVDIRHEADSVLGQLGFKAAADSADCQSSDKRKTASFSVEFTTPDSQKGKLYWTVGKERVEIVIGQGENLRGFGKAEKLSEAAAATVSAYNKQVLPRVPAQNLCQDVATSLTADLPAVSQNVRVLGDGVCGSYPYGVPAAIPRDIEAFDITVANDRSFGDGPLKQPVNGARVQVWITTNLVTVTGLGTIVSALPDDPTQPGYTLLNRGAPQSGWLYPRCADDVRTIPTEGRTFASVYADVKAKVDDLTEGRCQ